MQTINVGLIGGGNMARAHALAYAAMPLFFSPPPAMPRRSVLADVTEELAAGRARELGFERSTDDWRKVVDDPTVDLVDIVTPNNLHREIAIAALEAGKHVLCAKPLARTATESAQMYRVARRSGRVHMVAFNYRFVPAVAMARRLIAEGAVGRVLNFRGEYLSDWSASTEVPHSWRFDRAVAGSGASGDIGSHVVDAARSLVGEIAAVCAVSRTHIPQRAVVGPGDEHRAREAQVAPVDVDDEIVALVRFDAGQVGSVEASRHAIGRKNAFAFEIHGEVGSIRFDYEHRDVLQIARLDAPADERGFKSIYMGHRHPYQNLWQGVLGTGFGESQIAECYELFSAIAEGREISPSFADGHQAMLVGDAILESAELGQWVDVSRTEV